MDNLEEKLNSILANPQMMSQIMSMAQNLGQSAPQEPPKQNSPSLSDIDPARLQQMMGLIGQTGIDREQQTLLKALEPYLTRQRISKLERAMRAAKLANLASSLLASGALHF